MKDIAYFVKTSILMILMTVESYFVTQMLLNYVRSEDYFTPSIKVLGAIGLSLLVLIYTYSLSVGAWRKWEQFIVVPFPISLGIFTGVYFLDTTHAVLLAVISYILLSYDVFIATSIRNQLIKFNPVTILRFSTRGILFLFSVLAAVLVFLHSADKRSDFNLGGKVADLAESTIGAILKPKIDSSNTPPIEVNELDENAPPPDPELSEMPENPSNFINGLPSFNLDLRDTIQTEVDNIIRPYKQFIPPLIALVVFALIRFLGTVVHITFNITAPIVFSLAKKFSLLHSYYVPAQKEELSFTSHPNESSEQQVPPDLTPQA